MLNAHIIQDIMSCAQRCTTCERCEYSMTNSTSQTVHRSVTVAQLVNADTPRCGFCTAADREQLEALNRCDIRSAVCSTD